MNDDIINRYTLMLIKQYWEKKKARSEIQAMLRHWQIIADFIRNPDNFDLDRVTGYRLDVIGRIVGLPRSVPAVIARVFFGFDGHLDTAGFDSKSNAAYVGAPFYSKFSPAYGDYQLADNEYRRFLRVKIARNAAGSTIASDDRVSLQDVIQTAFNGEAYVTDRKDMTLALNVSPRVSVEELRLIVKLGLLPKPAGVRYDYFYQVTPGLTFGFSRNPSARGFASKFNTAYQGGFFRGKSMSKIARYQGNVRAFASDAQGMERTVFGGTNQADDLTSQITASFLRGWGIVGASEHPSLEDFNAAMYAMSQFIAYQHQMGVPEWHAEQEYHIGSICTHNGESYQSLQNANIGSQPPSAKWTPVLTSKNGLANLGLGETINKASGAMQKSANGSDISDVSAFRNALQLGTAATRDVGADNASKLLDLDSFRSMMSGNGYIYIPCIATTGNPVKLMLQWGTVATQKGADAGYALPFAFPYAGLFATGNRGTSGYNAAMNVRIASRTHISVQNWAPSGEGTEDCCFIALGY